MTTNLITDEFYYGVHKTSQVDDNYLGSGSALRKAIRRYGAQAFKKSTVKTYQLKEEAYEHERKIIKDTLGNEKCYNLRQGGIGGNPRMGPRAPLPIPVQRALRLVGEQIGNARKRRGIPMKLLSERAGITRQTLTKIEAGENVSFGSLSSVMFSLGMIDEITNLAASDEVGNGLQDERLPKRIRLRRSI